MPSRRKSRSGSLAWVLAALALAVYAGAATVVLTFDPRVSLKAPWWGWAVPPIVYAIVAVAVVRRLAIGRVLAATAGLCTAHGLLLAGTVAVVASVAPEIRSPLWSAALGLVTLVCVPLVLMPLRSLVQARPPASRRPIRPTAPVPTRAPTATAKPAPGRSAAWPAPAAKPWPAPASRPSQPASLSPGGNPWAKPPDAPVPVASPSPAPAPPAPRPLASPKPPAPVPPPPPPGAPTQPAADSVEEVIRIPFARVADQFPTEIFAVPRDTVGATLLEADHLLIPERLVRPQLAEGLVQVGWPIVAEQFPRQSLALSAEEIARRLPNGALMLPLDEVVRQIPAGVFALSSPGVDVQALEDFPLPFQPHLPAPASTAPDVPAEVTDEVTEPPAPAAEPAPIEPVEPTMALEPEPVAPEPAPAELESGPAVAELEVPVLASEPAMRELELGAPESEPPVRELEPWEVETAPSPIEGTSQVLPPSDDSSPTPDARRMAALLGPLLNPVTVETYEGPGTTFLTLAPLALAGPMVADVAARVLPFLTDTRLPEPALQATVRGTAMTVVITPLAGAPNSALAAATTAGASLAMLERLCLRAAAVPVGHGRRPAAPTVGAPGAELQEAPPEPTVRAVAESLQAFGPVTPTVLRDPDGALVVYLFLPRGLEARPLAGFSRDLHEALAGSPAGELASVILRVGTRRVLIRAVESARGAVLVAGGGPVERPGMARLELERAAARLGRL